MAHLFAVREEDGVPPLRAIAHDLNNLLTAISGYGNLLAMSEELSEEARADANEIVGAAAQAVTLVRQLQTHS